MDVEPVQGLDTDDAMHWIRVAERIIRVQVAMHDAVQQHKPGPI